MSEREENIVREFIDTFIEGDVAVSVNYLAKDASYYFNAWHEPISFTLPPRAWAASWTRIVDTATGEVTEGEAPLRARACLTVAGRSLVLLQRAS